MRFDIPLIRKQLASVPVTSPYPHDLAVAIICDTFRMANVRPPSRQDWAALEDHANSPLWREQVGMLAHVLASSSLRETTAQVLVKSANATDILQRFFANIAPLTAEMVRSNAFRQEEFLRKWAHVVGGEVKDESPSQSTQRLNQLDYRKAQQEMVRAEEIRRKEAEQREKMLAEAARREAEARGWRE
ncbi:hypothetical protein HPC49_38775 [Pyxidicoccus fallax]|uniref:Uncharacterized protein n=1 Tax=Pyxidicoccus fallax TaxID=394095 RepID=A0A848LCY4_9BACT|nr:hypothetical protein [Pyxidicoccus fallax]NMO16092.1 hypothetical protein [Pyxidicoccus fallax]NPC84143.1 hypothetical protein [Pyxidicoccus fallax]